LFAEKVKAKSFSRFYHKKIKLNWIFKT